MDAPASEDAVKAAEHELLLEFPHFNENSAWELGHRLRAAADAAGQAVLIDVSLGEHCVFRCAMPGTTPSNSDWARRKRNAVNMLHVSSYRISLARQHGHDPLVAMALDPRDHAGAGGCFPIRVTGTGFVGTVTVSGLPEREDHRLVVDVIADYLGVDLGDSRL